jgi:hypothetical protein
MTLVTSGPGVSCPIRRSSKAVVCVVLLSPLCDARPRSKYEQRNDAEQTCLLLCLLGPANATTTTKKSSPRHHCLMLYSMYGRADPKLLSLWSGLANGAAAISGMLCGCGS